MTRPFTQVDVFTDVAYRGNALAVVHDADGLSDADMAAFARWTNLSETTFLLPPTTADADYRVRIFTPSTELPFAGHPTLGTCHAWLERGGVPRDAARVVQECGAGLVPIRRDAGRLAFAAPPLIRSGPVEPDLLAAIARALGISTDAIVDAAWTDNGPGWATVLLASADDVLALKPSFLDQDIGVVGPHPAAASPAAPASTDPSAPAPTDASAPAPTDPSGAAPTDPSGAAPTEPSAPAWELRAFFPLNGTLAEDPVTGSLNAGVAQWLLETGRATAPYVARQGTAIARDGRVFVAQDEDGTIWVGGDVVTSVSGTVEL